MIECHKCEDCNYCINRDREEDDVDICVDCEESELFVADDRDLNWTQDEDALIDE